VGITLGGVMEKFYTSEELMLKPLSQKEHDKIWKKTIKKTARLIDKVARKLIK
jgi:hypothetical protein